MTPQYKLLFGSSGSSSKDDLTSIYAPFVQEISLTDNITDDNDELEITCINPGPSITRPPVGASYTLFLGYKETEMVNMGTFSLEEYSLKGSKSAGHTITIKCNSKTQDSTLTQPRDQAHENKSVGEIVNAVAAKSNYVADVSAYYFTVVIDYEAQQNTTDQVFLSGLAKRYNATFKIKDGVLYFKERSKKTDVNGDAISQVTVTGGEDVLGYELVVTPQAQASAVRVNYKDEDGDNTVVIANYTLGANKAVQTSSGDSLFFTAPIIEPSVNLPTAFEIKIGKFGHLPYVFSDKEKAVDAGKSQLADEARKGKELSLTLIGNPRINAGSVVNVTKLSSEIDGEWIMNKVTHKFSKGGGYTTECDTDAGDSSDDEYGEVADPDAEYPSDPDAEIG